MHRILIPIAFVLVWGTSSYMSVAGLTAAIPGNMAVIMLMGCGLELGKISLVIFLHRRWKSLGVLSRAFYIAVALCLTCMTSIEVMGYLSQRHAEAVRGMAVSDARITSLDREAEILRRSINTVDATLAGLPEGYVTRRIVERRKAGYDRMQARLIEIAGIRAGLTKRNIEDTAYSGPVFAAARLMGVGHEQATTLFILALVLIFEPLSLGLAVASSAVMTRADETGRPHGHENGQPAEPAKGGHENGQSGQRRPKTAIEVKSRGYERPTLTAELNKLMIDYDLTAADVAAITGKKQAETANAWAAGQPEIPIKALRKLRKWTKGKRKAGKVFELKIGD